MEDILNSFINISYEVAIERVKFKKVGSFIFDMLRIRDVNVSRYKGLGDGNGCEGINGNIVFLEVKFV